MRNFFIILALLCAPVVHAQDTIMGTGHRKVAASGSGSVVQVFQAQGNSGNGYTFTATSGSNVTSGNVLVIFTSQIGTDGSTPVPPTGCVIWTQQGSTDTAGDSLYSGPITTTGPCVVTGGLNYVTTGATVFEITGVINTVDGTPLTGSVGGVNPVSSPSVITTVSNDLVLSSCIGNSSTIVSILFNSPFSSNFSGSIGSYVGAQGSKVQASAGTVTPTFNGGVSGQTAFCGTIAFKP